MKFFYPFLLFLLSFIIYGVPFTGLDQYPTPQEEAFYNHHSQQKWKLVHVYDALEHQGSIIFTIPCTLAFE